MEKKGDGTLPEGEVTVTLSGVHMCCGDCEKAIQGSLAAAKKKILIEDGIKMTTNREDKNHRG